MINILITGASGPTGAYLSEYFAHKGYTVFAHSSEELQFQNKPNLFWITKLDQIIKAEIHYVINLTPESIFNERWSKKFKENFINHCVFSTRDTYEWLENNNKKPKYVFNLSSTFYYGISPGKKWDQSLSENSPPQPFFISEVYSEFESEIKHFKQPSKILRVSNIIGRDLGHLNRFIDPIKNNLYEVNSPESPISWIHIDDVCSAIEFLFHTPTSEKVFNLTAPNQLKRKDFNNICRSHFNKKSKINSIPPVVIQALMGERADAFINGQYCSPTALNKLGFSFLHSDFKAALEQTHPINTKVRVFRKIYNAIQEFIQTPLTYP